VLRGPNSCVNLQIKGYFDQDYMLNTQPCEENVQSKYAKHKPKQKNCKPEVSSPQKRNLRHRTFRGVLLKLERFALVWFCLRVCGCRSVLYLWQNSMANIDNIDSNCILTPRIILHNSGVLHILQKGEPPRILSGGQ